MYYDLQPDCKEEPAMLGCVDLCGAVLSNNSDGEHAFFLWGAHLGRDYALQASTAQGKREWVAAILRSITWHTTPTNVTAMLAERNSASAQTHTKRTPCSTYLKGRLDGTILLSGALWRKSGLIGKYRNRSYELRSEGLLFYWKPNTGPILDKKHGDVFKILNVRGASAALTSDGFSVHGPHLKRVYTFLSETAASCKKWVQTINRLSSTPTFATVQEELPVAGEAEEETPPALPVAEAPSSLGVEEWDSQAASSLEALHKVVGHRIAGSLPQIARLRHALQGVATVLEESSLGDLPRQALQAAHTEASQTLETWVYLYAMERAQGVGESLFLDASVALSDSQLCGGASHVAAVEAEMARLREWADAFEGTHKREGCCAAGEFVEAYRRRVAALGETHAAYCQESLSGTTTPRMRLPSLDSSDSQLETASTMSCGSGSPEQPAAVYPADTLNWRDGFEEGGEGPAVPVPLLKGCGAQPVASPRSRKCAIAGVCAQADSVQDVLVRRQLAKNRAAVGQEVKELVLWRQNVLAAAEAYGRLSVCGQGVVGDALLATTITRIDTAVKV